MATMALAVSDGRAAERIVEAVKDLVNSLEREAERRVGLRTGLEQRWIENLLAYHGKYSPKVQADLKKSGLSQLATNLIGPKTDAMSARLMDILFPTDDRNWGIGPTPVPQLTKEADAAMQAASAEADAAKQAAEASDPNAAAMAESAATKKKAADQLHAILQEAASRAELMQEEMDDQLKSSQYHAVMRDVIEDGCKLGTGVCKGPVTGDRVRKGWKKQPVMQDGQPVINQDGSPVEQYQLKMGGANDTPAFRHVDIWGFFPDPDVKRIKDGNGTFERYLKNPKQMRAMARLPGFNKNAIRRLLEMKPRQGAPSFVAELRTLSDAHTHTANDVFHVWEYSGPIDANKMRDLALFSGDIATYSEMTEIDPLIEINAVVWFCQGEILKFAIYPLDSDECMYSVFNLKEDEYSIFGYGIPEIARDPADASSAAFRAMLNNAAFTAGPQIVVAKQHVKPENGEYKIEPHKVWVAEEGIPNDHRAFDAFNVPSTQTEMANIMAICKQMVDDMTGMPPIAQGEQGTGTTKTAQGMAILMNSSNVTFRRIVKNFDDGMTVPNIRRLYDWNMQFNPKEEIKGDYDVDARGSSVLLVREMQAQNLMLIALQFSAHPVFGPMLKNRSLLRMLFRAHMISPDEVMLTDTEIDEIVKAAAEAQQAQMEAEQAAAAGDGGAGAAQMAELKKAEIDAKVAIENMKTDAAIRVAELQHETAMMKMAETMNMSLDKIRADLEKDRANRASKERMVAAEVAMAQRTGEHAGGSI